MPGMEFRTTSVERTVALGERIGCAAARLSGSICLALHGNLGAGKTQLTRGIALGAGVVDPTLVASPTYVLLNVYQAGDRARDGESKTVYHMDAYRIASEEDFDAVGFEELLAADGILVVEWAEKVLHLLPEDRVEITIEPGEADDERIIGIDPRGATSEALAREIAVAPGIKKD